MIAHHILNQPLRIGRGELVFRLPLEFRFTNEDRKHRTGRCHQIVRRDERGLAIVHALAMGAQAAHQRVAETLFVRTALRGGNGVAIGADKGIGIRCPGNRPFHRPLAIPVFGAAREFARRDGGAPLNFAAQEVEQAAGKFQRVFGGRGAGGFDERGIAFPADLDTAKQIGLRPRHAVEQGGGKMRVLEYLPVGFERNDRAAPVDGSHVFQFADGMPALEAHLVGLSVARDLDLHPFGERVHHRGPHAMEAARRIIDLAAELPAGMQRGHDDFQRRLVLEFGMRVDRDAAAIVADCQDVVRLEIDLDAGGMARHCLVHRVVEDFGGQMVQRPLIGSPDIHAGPAAHGFQPLQNFDVLGGIALGRCGRGVEKIGRFGHVCSR